ncbi:MAG: NADH dehydrogenase, partial [uncultured Thermomicrobiales bacterium]
GRDPDQPAPHLRRADPPAPGGGWDRRRGRRLPRRPGRRHPAGRRHRDPHQRRRAQRGVGERRHGRLRLP